MRRRGRSMRRRGELLQGGDGLPAITPVYLGDVPFFQRGSTSRNLRRGFAMAFTLIMFCILFYILLNFFARG